MAVSTNELDAWWLMFGAVLVFFMQTGFAMLEVGCVQVKNTRNILLKNVLDASFGALTWWLLGYGIAMGDSSGNGFVGTTAYALNKADFMVGDGGYLYAFWLFQWAFAATTATIVSGAVAERCTFTAYVLYSIFLTSFVYPFVASWIWNVDGWLSAWRTTDLFAGCGVTDFAGSGVVHMTGGVAAFWGSFFLGPRKSVVAGTHTTPEYGPVFQTLGALILWMGWYGFNGASTLYIVNYAGVAAKTMVTTTIAAGTCAVVTTYLGSFIEGKTAAGKYAIKLDMANNGLLAGLVAITAGCSTVEPYGAFLIGVLASPVYLFSSRAIKSMGIDDVVDAFPVHGCCGAFGVFMTGFFATKDNYSAAYYGDRAGKCAGVLYGGSGNMLGANIVSIIVIFCWVTFWSCVLFGGLKSVNLLRVDDAVEEEGLDSSEHGASPKQIELSEAEITTKDDAATRI